MTALADAANGTNCFLHVDDISYAGDYFLALSRNIFYESVWNKFQQDMEVVTADNIYLHPIQFEDEIVNIQHIFAFLRNKK
jgi:hypothetical protein